ncbi:MAG: DUF3558 domain-containing protein [Pseudonocardiaceae bacterium]
MRALVSAVLAVAAMTLAGGCGQQVSGAPVPSGAAGGGGGALASVDMCTVFSDAELQSLGIRLDTREQDDIAGSIGCGWLGEPFTLSLARDVEETVDDFAARQQNFVSFHENEVAGRPGAQLQVAESGQECAQVMNAGSGSVLVGVRASSSRGPQLDWCAEARRIAEMIAPRVPEAES